MFDILAGPQMQSISAAQELLQTLFKLKLLGPLQYFLGLEVASSPKGIYLCKNKYATQLLQDTGFTNCKSLHPPMDPNIKLTDSAWELLVDPSQYRRLIGRLIYLTITRPDIAFAVNKLSQFMTAPQTPHLPNYLKFLTDSIIPALVEELHKVNVIQVFPILKVYPIFVVLLWSFYVLVFTSEYFCLLS